MRIIGVIVLLCGFKCKNLVTKKGLIFSCRKGIIIEKWERVANCVSLWQKSAAKCYI